MPHVKKLKAWETVIGEASQNTTKRVIGDYGVELSGFCSREEKWGVITLHLARSASMEHHGKVLREPFRSSKPNREDLDPDLRTTTLSSLKASRRPNHEKEFKSIFLERLNESILHELSFHRFENLTHETHIAVKLKFLDKIPTKEKVLELAKEFLMFLIEPIVGDGEEWHVAIMSRKKNDWRVSLFHDIMKKLYETGYRFDVKYEYVKRSYPVIFKTDDILLMTMPTKE